MGRPVQRQLSSAIQYSAVEHSAVQLRPAGPGRDAQHCYTGMGGCSAKLGGPEDVLQTTAWVRDIVTRHQKQRKGVHYTYTVFCLTTFVDTMQILVLEWRK